MKGIGAGIRNEIFSCTSNVQGSCPVYQKMIPETVVYVYSTDRVHVAFTKSPSGNCVIQVSGDPRLLEDVKTDVRQFVQQIVHKTVRFRRAGREISQTCAV